MVLLHVLAGGFGIISGFASMAFAKGSQGHRRAGQVYVWSMLTMTTSALIIALFISRNPLNVVAAGLTFYLVASAWMTVHRQPENPQRAERLMFIVGLLAGATGLAIGLYYLAASDVPSAAFVIVFGVIAFLASWGDLRLLRRRTITRGQKLARHLWRMGLSLLIAAMSLFLGQARHLPAWLTGPKFNVVPVLLALGLLIYWSIRVRRAPWTRNPRATIPAAGTAAAD